jgi:serine/threonine protein kinase
MVEREEIGRYRILSRISQGGMGAVYLAEDPQLHRKVAIKLLLESLDNDEWRKRFHREARALARLVHPNIVTIFDFGEDARGRPFIVMEYVEGRHLGELAQDRLTFIEKLGFIVSLCEGLDCAHTAGITHLDIKPANLIVEKGGRLKIVDFGIARVRDSRATLPEVRAGTPSYMAPELLTGGDVGPRTDQFAAGIVAYELLSGRRAFDGSMREIITKICAIDPPPLSQACPGIDPALDVLVMRALSKDPSGRFATMAAMGRALVRIRERLDSHNLPTIPAAGSGAHLEGAPTVAARPHDLQPETVSAEHPRNQAAPLLFASGTDGSDARRWAPPPVLWTIAAGLMAVVVTAILLWPSNQAPISGSTGRETNAAAPPASVDAPVRNDASNEPSARNEDQRPPLSSQAAAAVPREIQAALQQFSGGSREVLSAVESAQRRYPRHPELVDLLARLEDRSRQMVSQRKLAAEAAGATATADYERALAAERDAAEMKRQGLAEGAIRKFWDAEDFYAAAAESARDITARDIRPSETAAPVAADPRAEVAVRAALQSLGRAYQTLSGAAVKSVYPNLTPEQVRALDRNFLEYSAYALDIRDVRIAIKGNRATANCALDSTVTLRNGTERRTTTRATFTLENTSGAWVMIGSSRLP